MRMPLIPDISILDIRIALTRIDFYYKKKRCLPHPHLVLERSKLGLLRVSEYSDIRGSEYKIEYGYSSLPKSLDRDLCFFFYLFLTETRSFSQNNPLKIFTLTTVLIDNSSYLNTFVSCRLDILYR